DGAGGDAGTGGSGTGGSDDVAVGAGGGLADGGASAVGGSFGGGQRIPVRNGVCKETAPVQCDDHDVCTIDTCDSLTGACGHEPATFDNDGDGHQGPREGTLPGDPDACGDDCDDTNKNAFPGNTEVCDGVDNDCNGIVDDSANFVPIDAEQVVVSTPDFTNAGAGGLAWSGTSYAAIYSGSMGEGFDIYRAMLAPDGTKVVPQDRLTSANSDSAGGPVVWTGDRYGVLWQERPNNDYEIYFRELDAGGVTVETNPVRVSDGFAGFSVNPDLAWSGTKFVAVWQDERDGVFDIYGQLLGIDGDLVGSDVLLSDGSDNLANESPTVAASSLGVGVVWARGGTAAHFMRFRAFGPDLMPMGPSIDLNDGTTDAEYPIIVWNKDSYVVAWADGTASPKAIYATVLDELGNVIVPPRPITSPGSGRSRYPTVRALGDRLLFVYGDTRDTGEYELYARMVSKDLDPLGNELRITNAPGISVNPKAAFGPDGNLGILFRDHRNGLDQVFFTRLGCVVPTP
ncbi:MAG TPA: putative metal-binding motif-containing protein, partial [Polyangiaceae bacterium]|nr:putative metal-binding motif-containing protein [Polyangiaceae bacterium]